MVYQAEVLFASFLCFLLELGLWPLPLPPHLSSACGVRSGRCGSADVPCPTVLQRCCSVDLAEESLERDARVQEGLWLSEILQ